MEVWDAGFVIGPAWLVHLDDLHFSPAGPGSICPVDHAGLSDPESSLRLFLLRAQVHVSVSTVFGRVSAGWGRVCARPGCPITEALDSEGCPPGDDDCGWVTIFLVLAGSK